MGQTIKAIARTWWGKVIFVLLVILLAESSYVAYAMFRPPAAPTNIPDNLPTISAADLAQYDGTDPSKPIYIGLDGYVYDVTTGRSFYQTGGAYHTLAGQDSSKELQIFGGDIIKKKYPVVAILGP